MAIHNYEPERETPIEEPTTSTAIHCPMCDGQQIHYQERQVVFYKEVKKDGRKIIVEAVSQGDASEDAPTDCKLYCAECDFEFPVSYERVEFI
jgi:tRNA(Arg) A34 adenosine deaminase TadA